MRKFKYPLIIGILLVSVVTFAITSKNSSSQLETATASTSDENDEGGVIYLSAQSFKEYVFDYEKNQTWKYEGKVPAILDFYADWCGPCKMLSPVLKDLQKEYGGKIQVYKINTDKEKELASTFGIRSLPTIVFVPLEGDPNLGKR
eukprot:Anaeramoba_ignava/c7905_g1_i2.p1 GENE.c7905_g1_i2~~c7905_g1_i2.p1  ORF type:complete len:146 (-),score=9.85 c7905_g1_i2:21-458(-)